MVPGKRYVVKYGSTQVDTSRGTGSRNVTVFRQGLSSETAFFREGTPIVKGVWVLDHSDSDRKVFFSF